MLICSSSRTVIKAILCIGFANCSLLISAQGAGTSVTGKIETLPDAPQMIAAVSPSLRDSAFAFAIADDFQSTSAGQQNSSPVLQDHKKPSNEPTLDDLGLPADQTKPDPDMQARLDRRTYMLKMHQRMGLLTLAPLAAACISSAAAPPDPRNGSGNTVGRDIHLSLGSLSVLSYGATAYYAIRAPRVSDGPARGGIKLHKYLIYIHGPGMILTPILGAMAFNQANNGEKVHGIASAHAAVAWTTVAAYSTAIVAVSWPIHLKF